MEFIASDSLRLVVTQLQMKFKDALMWLVNKLQASENWLLHVVKK